MSAVSLDGDLIHYEVLGRGRPVILIHSWIGSWRYWIPTMQQLHLGYCVYAIDLFGFGDSGKNPARYPITQQVSMLKRFMNQQKISKAAIIGHGLGALVAAEFAFRYQREYVPRIMLISPPLFDIGNLHKRVPQRRYQEHVKKDHPWKTTTVSTPPVHTNPSSETMRIAISERDGTLNDIHEQSQKSKKNKKDDTLETRSRPDSNLLTEFLEPLDLMVLLERCFKSTDDEFEKLQKDVKHTDPAVLNRSAYGFSPGKMLDTVRQLEIPTVLIHGEEDPIIPLPAEAVWEYVSQDHPDEFIGIPLPHVRHFPMLEHERFGSFVNNFLETRNFSELELKERWHRRSR